MRLAGAIRAGVVGVLGVYSTFYLEKYAMGLLPDKPNLLVNALFALSVIGLIICTFFWDYVVGVVTGRWDNWDSWSAVRYLRKWTRLHGCILEGLEEELRAAAFNQKIRVWASSSFAAEPTVMPAEKFAEFTFDLRHATQMSDRNINLPPQFVPKIYERGQRDNFLHPEIYYFPRFNKREIKRIWRQQWFRALWRWIGGEKRRY
jgi:hypothetical protein